MEKEFTKSYAIKRIAELTEQIEEWRSLYSALMKDCQMQIEEYNKIKNQLEEKEKELRYKTAECEKWKTDYENCSKLEKMMTKERQYCLDNWRVSDQDKISFCIEQLEKVKEYCRQKAYHDSYGDYMIVYERRYYEDDEEKTPNDDLMGFLDNQIKEIKGESNGNN